MREEKVAVLRRLQNEEITAEQAAQLLEQLDQPQAQSVENPVEVQAAQTEKPKKTFNLGKMLRIKVLSSDGDRVNVQVPLAFARFALKQSNGFLDKKIQSNMDVDVDALLEMIEKGNIGKLVDIVSADGDSVEIVID